MSLNPDIPKIAITPESEEDDNFLSIIETLTDSEGIDEEESLDTNSNQKVARKNKLKIKLTDNVDTTDYEDYEASDNDDDVKLVKHVSLDDMNLETSTYEESFKVQEISDRGKKKVKAQNSSIQMKKELDKFKEAYKNLTDEELFNTDTEMQSEESVASNVDFEYYNDDGNVTEKFKLKREDCSEDILDNMLKINQLSVQSLSPNLSDLTDVEVLFSDSNDEPDNMKGKSRRRRRRLDRKYSVTDVEDFEMSDHEIGDITQNKRPSRKHARLSPMIKSQSLNFESDNEGNGYFRFPICKKAVKKSVLKTPHFETDFVTDTEDVEGEAGDRSPLLEKKPLSDISFVERLNDIAAYCSQTTEINTLVRNKHFYTSVDKDKESSKQKSTESDNCQGEDGDDEETWKKNSDYNILLSPKPKQNALHKYKINEDVKEQIVTDSEDTDSFSDEATSIPSMFLREYSTEEENFVDDTFDSTYQIPEIELPPPTRNLFILKENNPLPTVHIMPLEDNVPEKIQLQELSMVPTDEESISDAEDALEILATGSTPEVSSLDFGFVEIIETLGQKLKMSHADNDTVTDTEELTFDDKEKRRRAPKFKYLHEKSLALKNILVINEETALLTDTEDIYLNEGNAEANYLIPRQSNDGVTDIENLSDSSEDDKDAETRPLSYTPQHMREIEGETVVAKEGAGPFTKEERISVNLHKKELQQIAVSPTNTDTEEMVASADEDNINYSRAETATPNQVHQEFDGISSSKVHVEILNKFDADVSSEIMYLKGGGYTERNTDVEDISDVEQEIEIDYNGMMNLEDYIFIGSNEKKVSLNLRDGAVFLGTGKGNFFNLFCL